MHRAGVKYQVVEILSMLLTEYTHNTLLEYELPNLVIKKDYNMHDKTIHLRTEGTQKHASIFCIQIWRNKRYIIKISGDNNRPVRVWILPKFRQKTWIGQNRIHN